LVIIEKNNNLLRIDFFIYTIIILFNESNNKFKKMKISLYKIFVYILFVVFSIRCIANTSYVGKVKSMQAGDVACYVDLIGDDGKTYQSLANFEICDKTRLIGKRVNIYYEQGNVMAASCEGDMDCRKTETVWIINKMTEIPEHQNKQYSDVPSHCFSNEKIIFSCNTNSNKVISVCSAQNSHRNSGYLQYRFGSVGYFPEYVFPMNHDRASKYFYSGNLMYSGGGGAYLKFINDTYNYVVYTGIGKGWAKQGMVIQDGDDEIARYACKGTWQSEIGPELFDQLGLNEDEYGFGIPTN